MERIKLRPPPAPPKRKSMAGAVLRLRERMAPKPTNAFQLPDFPKGVAPKKAQMAMDQDFGALTEWAGQQSFVAAAAINYQSAAMEGLAFPGYAFLAQLAQRPEYRRMVEIPATEMTRNWIKFSARGDGDDDKANRIKAMEDELDRLNIKHWFSKCAELDGFFGRAHLYIDTGDADDRHELKISIGNGRDEASKIKLAGKRINYLKSVEPVWTYPTNYDSLDPLKLEWYEPDTWYVLGKEVHKSRLLKFVFREVPDMLKPAYSFGGLSMSQMAIPYVNNWLKTRQSVADLISAFSTFVLKTDLSESLEVGGEELFQRAEAFNLFRNNKGLFLLDKDGEDFQNVSAPLGSLDHLQAQTQEHMACLPAGVLIETQRGQIPIEQVTTNDEVMTREGFKPVKWSGMTGRASRLIEIYFNDSVVRITPEHPIWSNSINAFVNAEHVSTSHRLCVRKTSSQENMESLSRGAADGGIRPKRDIIAMVGGVFSFMSRYGERIVEKFQQALKSIIRMKTRATINSEICDASPDLSIERSTIGHWNENTWPSARYAGPSSGSRTRMQSIARRIAGIWLIDASRNYTKKFASVVELISQRDVGMVGKLPHDFVPALACSVSPFAAPMPTTFQSHDIGKSNADITNDACAARKSSQQNWTKRSFVRRDASIDTVTAVQTVNLPVAVPVYNLEVDGPPEFFANGVLVHNSVSGIPLVKLTGISPSGLNATSEFEMRVFYDSIKAAQEKFFRPNLTKIVDMVQLTLFGEVDQDIVFEFEPLWSLDEKGAAEVNQVKTQTGIQLVEAGIISQEEERKRVANDPHSDYSSIKVDELPEPPGMGQPGMEGMGGLQPGEEQPPGGPEMAAGAPGMEAAGEAPDEEPEAIQRAPFEEGRLRPDYIAEEAAQRDAQPDDPSRGSPKNRALAAAALKKRDKPGYKGELHQDYLKDENPLGEDNPLSNRPIIAREMNKEFLKGKHQTDPNYLKNRIAEGEAHDEGKNDQPPHNPPGHLSVRPIAHKPIKSRPIKSDPIVSRPLSPGQDEVLDDLADLGTIKAIKVKYDTDEENQAEDKAEFKEADHPRENDGKFTSSGGAGGGHTDIKELPRQSESAASENKGTHQNVGGHSGRTRTKVVDGKRTLESGGELPEHISKLKIPPAWTDVEIDTRPDAKVLVIGKDAKGRTQSIYSAEHTSQAAQAKFSRIKELNDKFDSIVKQNEEAMKSDDQRIKDTAECLDLIMKMGVRPGSETDTGGASKAYGATTLQGRHVVRTEAGSVYLRFIGKKGVKLSLKVNDPKLAAMLEARSEKAGERGKLFPETSDKILLDHTHSLDGGGFKTKDMRTRLGTSLAQEAVDAVKKPPTNMKEYKKAVREVAKKVSDALGNTPTIALQSYISPTVFAAWKIAA
jgi:DNA topoisomerase IB